MYANLQMFVVPVISLVIHIGIGNIMTFNICKYVSYDDF